MEHLAAGIEVLRSALAGVPPKKVRYHVCWGNVTTTHHRDVELSEIADLVLRAPAKFIYVEAANPRHEHEWEVWKRVKLPDDKALIVGVIDVKTNHVEHPRLVAQRIERFADIVGRERVVAGTDCGFATFLGMHHVLPRVAWMKLESLVRGAEMASDHLWSRARAGTTV